MAKKKLGYQAFLDDQKKREQEKAKGQVRFAEASRASRPQYTLDGYEGSSRENNYKWESNLLKDLKVKGKRSYNDKYDVWARSQGMTDAQAADYRRFQDFQEDRNQELKINKDGSVSKGQNVRAGQGARLESELFDDIFNKMQQRAKEANNPSVEFNKLTKMDKVKNALGMDLSKEKQNTLEAKQLGLEPKNIRKKEWEAAKLKATSKAADDVSKERKGVTGFLDSTLGRMGDASHKIFGQEFVNAENENYANLAINKLKKNPKDKHAKQSLQMLNTTARAPKNKLEKVSDFIGTAAGELAPYTIGGAYGLADAALGKVGLNAIKNPLAKDLIRGFGAGAIAGTEKAVTRKLASNEQLTPAEYAKRIGTEAAFASGGDALLGSVLRNINLKGQVSKLYGETGSKVFNEAEFKNALQEAYAPKGDISKVVNQASQTVKPNPQQVLEQFKSEWKNPNQTTQEGPVVLKSLNKDVTQLPKEELQKIYKQLVDEHDVSLIAGNPSRANVINEDLSRIDDLIKNGPPKEKAPQPSFVLNDIPKVEMPNLLEDITPETPSVYDQLYFGQSSKYQPKARKDLSPVERSLDPMNRPQSYWKQRYEDFANEIKTNGYTPNNLSKEALDDLWSQYAKYDEPVSLDDAVELAYGKGPQSKLTDQPFNYEERLNNFFAPKPNIKDALKADPKIAEALKQFDDLAPGSKNPKYALNGQYGEATVEDAMNLLGKNTEKGNPLSQAINELNAKYQGLAKGKGKAEVKALQEQYLKERDSIYQQYAEQPLTSSQSLETPLRNNQNTDYLLNQLKLNGSTPKGEAAVVANGSKKLTLDEFNQLASGKVKPVQETPKTPKTTKKSVRPKVQEIAESKEPVEALRTVKTKKDINTMSQEELKTLQNDLWKKRQKSLKAKEYKKAKQIKEDLDKVDGLLMRLDLQLFGKEAEKEVAAAVQETTVVDNTVPKTEADNEFKDIKDINQFQVGTKNIYEIAERLPKQMGDNIKKSLDTAKTKYVSQLEKETNDLYNNVVKELGVKAGSKESALVQDFGEKTLGKESLRKQGIDPNEVTPEELDAANLQALKEKTAKWENIVKADEYFRTTYDRLIEEVNAVRKQIYPNDPEKIVPKRNDYYHHFNELEGFEGFKNLFDTPANIDPHLEGVSPYTKPKTKFQGFMQKRGLGPYKSDAVGGMLKYIKASAHSINVDPVIPTLRKTANDLANATESSKNANKIIEALMDHANDLAGKTNPYDRVTQKILSRKGMRLVNWVNGRVKSNMILGNFGSLVGQAGNIPLGIGKVKLHAFPGLKNTMEQSIKELFGAEQTAPIYQSTFLKERYADQLFRKFDQKLIQQPKRLAVWAMETADKANTRFIWNSMYSKGVKEGVKDAIKYADYETRKIVAGRGVGEVPLLQKSKTMQVFAPFTLEVGNQWKVLREMVGEKDAVGLITAMVAAYGLNKAAEQVRGMNIAFDPIDAIIDGYTKNDGTKGQKALNALGSLTGEVVGNIPGGGLLTQFANTEKKVPFTDLQFKELFGERDPNRFGTGITMAKAFEDPAYLLMPFGASQFRKSTRGIDASLSGAVYKGDNGTIPFGGPKEELMYPMKNNLWDDLKLPIMGTSSTSSARKYYDNERKPLNENQTKAYKLLQQQGLGNELYDILRVEKTKASVKAKFTKIAKDPDLTPEEKIAALEELLAQVRGEK